MKPYSLDLRQRIFDAVQRGEGSLRELADLFRVSTAWVRRLLQRRRQTGSFAALPHAGGPQPKLDDAHRGRLLVLVAEQPDATLAELRDRLAAPVHLSTVARALDRLGLSFKKKVLHAAEQGRPDVRHQRATYCGRVAAIDPDRLVFVDECGANTAMTRPYGRAPVGERVVGSVPHGKWKATTLISAMRRAGVVASLVFEGPTDEAAFRTYVERVLVPEVRPGDVVVWDNLKPHKDAEAIRAIEAVGASVEPLPP